MTQFLRKYWLPMALGAMLWTLAIYLVGIAFAQPISTFVRKGGDFWNGPMVSLYTSAARPALEIRAGSGTGNAALTLPGGGYLMFNGETTNSGYSIRYNNGTGNIELKTNNILAWSITNNSGKLVPGPFTDTSGTPGNATANTTVGKSAFAAAGTAAVITNNTVTTSSLIFAVCSTNDATARITSCVPAAGSFTCNTVATTGITNFSWWVIN